MRASNPVRLTAVGLAVLLIAGPLAPPGHAQTPNDAQGPVRGISVFPEAETKGVATAEVPPLSEPAHDAKAVMARLATFPQRLAWCVLGEVLGFFVGSVVRVPVWAATAGDRVGSSEGLDRLGTTIVEYGCGDSLIVTAEDLKRWQSRGQQPTEPMLQPR